jgi:hypothetical protein
MHNDSFTGFIIEHYDEKQNSIIVRPYSPDFKNEKSAYPCFNISITNLDPEQNIEEQIALLARPIVETILKQEAETNLEKIQSFLQKNTNTPILVNNKELEKIEHNNKLLDLQQPGVLEILV